MKEKNLTGNYFWTKRWFGGFNLWVEIKYTEGWDIWETKYIKGNIADMNSLGIELNKKI
jgi:hypothetical protein